MKNLVIAILLAAAVVFGGFYLWQIRKTDQAKTAANAMRQKADDLQSSLDEQQKRATHLRSQLEETRADAAAKTREAARLQESLTHQEQPAAGNASEATNAKPSNIFAEMFKNPEMKEMIKNQQKAALGPMIDKNYAKLFSDLHLTSEQAGTLKDMLLNKQLAAADVSMSLMSGDQDAAKRADLMQQVKQGNDAADAQIKEFLGDDSFAQFQSYEGTMGERMAVSGFKDQLGSGSTALTDAQEEQLVQAMLQERQNFKFTTDFSDKSKINGDFASMFTEDRMNTYFQELGQLDQQYVTRAQGILSPDQATAFGKFLDNQQTLQKAGMQMAVKMFGSGK
jgi:hypothetical protein